MRLGYLARGHRGTLITLTDAKLHPRGQLLKKLGYRSAHKVLVDGKDGPKHIGYVVGTEWFTIYEVQDWKGGKV
jgi:hypothetical protein